MFGVCIISLFKSTAVYDKITSLLCTLIVAENAIPSEHSCASVVCFFAVLFSVY